MRFNRILIQKKSVWILFESTNPRRNVSVIGAVADVRNTDSVMSTTLLASPAFSLVVEMLNSMDDFPLSAIKIPGFSPSPAECMLRELDIYICKRQIPERLLLEYCNPTTPVSQRKQPMVIIVFDVGL